MTPIEAALVEVQDSVDYALSQGADAEAIIQEVEFIISRFQG